MTKRSQLKVEKRVVLGKKIKQLRQKGIIPANIYGKNIKSLALQAVAKDISSLYKKVKETSILEILIAKEEKPRYALIRNLQKNPVSGEILHVDFQQIDLKEKIETEVPVKIEGESLPVKDKKALLLQELDKINIEASADKLPEFIIVNVEKLEKIGQDLRIKDLKVPEGVVIKTDPEQIVVRLADLISKKAEKLEEAAAAEAAAEATAEVVKEAEGEKPGSPPSEDAKAE